MGKEFLMGNQAIALGAVTAGVNVVCGYPGTPSTEILETVAKKNDGSIYVEWSVNEKAALEVGAGAAYSGARVLVTMKQVGLNVAADPLMSLAYVGIKGGMVIVSADDPGPISSQTEQDTRHFAFFAKIPVFDPSSPEEAYQMIQDAFDYSEKYKTPVLFRPTTRVCHACASVEVSDTYKKNIPDGFVKDSSKWVIFPKLSYKNHLEIEKRNPVIGDDFSSYKFNKLTGKGKIGIACGGISRAYVKEVLESVHTDYRLLEIATAFPFPEKLALEFLDGLEKVIVFEELDPVIERELIYLCGKHHINVEIHGKIDSSTVCAGENSSKLIADALSKFDKSFIIDAISDNVTPCPPTPIRPPVLCAGCPHRASFYAVKNALKGKKFVASGDIGCYTLGNALPLDMVDTCLCMGADVTMAQGMHRIESDAINVAFIGDSTFFASGMTGIVNAVYNETDIILVVLDNSTTAMTGHQPHPGTGRTMMGNQKEGVSIEKILKAIGLSFVETVDPLDLNKAVDTVKKASETSGVKAIIFKSPCIAVSKKSQQYTIKENCISCKKCIKEIGCPAIFANNGKIEISPSLCFGCGLCENLCPVKAIVKKEDN